MPGAGRRTLGRPGTKIADKSHLSQRSSDADTRETVGHWEADLVICKRSRPVVAEETLRGFYVVVDVGQMGDKGTRLLRNKNDAAARGEQVSPIIFADGSRRASASKL